MFSSQSLRWVIVFEELVIFLFLFLSFHSLYPPLFLSYSYSFLFSSLSALFQLLSNPTVFFFTLSSLHLPGYLFQQSYSPFTSRSHPLPNLAVTCHFTCLFSPLCSLFFSLPFPIAVDLTGRWRVCLPAPLHYCLCHARHTQSKCHLLAISLTRTHTQVRTQTAF